MKSLNFSIICVQWNIIQKYSIYNTWLIIFLYCITKLIKIMNITVYYIIENSHNSLLF